MQAPKKNVSCVHIGLCIGIHKTYIVIVSDMRENAKMVAYRKAHGINELGMIVPMLCNGVLFSCQFFGK